MTSETTVRALFALAGIPVTRLWQLPNGYLGNLPPLSDEEIDRDTPGHPGVVRHGMDRTEGVVRNWMSDYRWRYNRPSWLAMTPYGLVQLTRRKRVDVFDWSETFVRGIITDDDTTKSETSVDAWSEEHLLGYMKAWGKIAASEMEARR